MMLWAVHIPGDRAVLPVANSSSRRNEEEQPGGYCLVFLIPLKVRRKS